MNMVEGWKKVHESKDVICFEKQTKKDNLRIEARLEEGAWHIYKTKYNGEKSNLVQQEVLSPSKDIMKKIKEMMMNQRPREQKKVQKSDRVDVKNTRNMMSKNGFLPLMGRLKDALSLQGMVMRSRWTLSWQTT